MPQSTSAHVHVHSSLLVLTATAAASHLFLLIMVCNPHEAQQGSHLYYIIKSKTVIRNVTFSLSLHYS